MVESIYTWMQNIVFYLVIVTAVLEVLPGGNYQKYIRFFTGLVLMILLLTPVLSLAGVKETFTELYHGYEYEQYKREIEEQEKYFEDLDLFEFLPEEYLYVQEDTFATDGEEAELRQDTPSYGKPVNEIKVEDMSIGEPI